MEIGNINNSIIHECIHWKYHKNFYEVLDLIKKRKKFYNNEQYINVGFNWIEYQAAQLSGRILMPKKMFLLKYNEIINKLRQSFPNLMKAELCELAINDLAEYFNVSKLATKVRLSQLNILESYGVYCYIDGKYHRAFQTNNDKSKTYLISFQNAVKLYQNNNVIKELVENKKIIYADGFYVLNDSKYVERKNNINVLTYLARCDVSKCCLEFVYTKKYSDYYTKVNLFFSKNQTNDELEINIDENSIQNSNILGISCNMRAVIEEIDEAKKLISKMNGSFTDSLNLLFNYSGIKSINDLSKLSNIDRRTLSNYLDGKSVPDIKKVLALCAAMELYPLVSKRLIEQAGLSIGNRGNDIDIIYMFLLNQCYHEGLDK